MHPEDLKLGAKTERKNEKKKKKGEKKDLYNWLEQPKNACVEINVILDIFYAFICGWVPFNSAGN